MLWHGKLQQQQTHFHNNRNQQYVGTHLIHQKLSHDNFYEEYYDLSGLDQRYYYVQH